MARGCGLEVLFWQGVWHYGVAIWRQRLAHCLGSGWVTRHDSMTCRRGFARRKRQSEQWLRRRCCQGRGEVGQMRRGQLSNYCDE